MNTSDPNPGERVRHVYCTDDLLIVDLIDGRTISVPLVWYPRLLAAAPEQRAHWEIAGGGFGIHWPDLDEDLSTEGLLRGAAAPPRPTREATELASPAHRSLNAMIQRGDSALTVLLLPLLWNVLAVDYVAWSFRDIWPGIQLKWAPVSWLLLLALTGVSVVSTHLVWRLLARRRATLMTVAGRALSFAPILSGLVAEFVLLSQVPLLG